MSRDDGISRRDLLRGRLRGAAPDPEPPPAVRVPLHVHRPPGAIEEPAFLEGCTRCGECITACPVDAITLAGPTYGPAAGTPIIEPMTSPCVMCEDLPCVTSCEPGVLAPGQPIRMGTARIETADCLAWNRTMCTVCSERCPVPDAIRVDNGKPTVVGATCTGCGVCQHVCPAPYNAVLILPVGAADVAMEPPPDTASFDWRAAYFQGRSLRPPDEDD